MNTESEIDVEKAAKLTLFFSRVEISGESPLPFRVNYLALLNLHTDVENTVKSIKHIITTEQKEIVERDTRLLLQARNWRFHLVACGVMLAGLNSAELLDQLWILLQRGSWVAPQIAATLFLLDGDFAERALDAITRESFNKQSVVALAQLLSENFSVNFTAEQLERVQNAKLEDSVKSDEIAVTWAETARPLFTAT
jgi:hypothetical protein